MISQRDIMMFFNIVDILSNPEKAKAELDMLNGLSKENDQKKEDLDKRELELKSKESKAQEIIDGQARSAKKLFDAAEEVDKKRVALDLLSGQLQRKAEEVQTNVEILAKRSDELDRKTKDLQDRETALGDNETRYNMRDLALKEKEKDYAERMKKLKAAVG